MSENTNMSKVISGFIPFDLCSSLTLKKLGSEKEKMTAPF